MDASTIDRLKHAQEVLGWKIDGKEFLSVCGDKLFTAVENPRDLVDHIMRAGGKYRLKPAKTIRPLTEQEARRLVGCVAVRNDKPSCVIQRAMTSVERAHLCEQRWHYHIPGDPDNLKPCWVEE